MKFSIHHRNSDYDDFFAESKNVLYEDTLRSLHLTTLETGRFSCELIETLTILKGFDLKSNIVWY
jgi:hypothetical protein